MRPSAAETMKVVGVESPLTLTLQEMERYLPAVQSGEVPPDPLLVADFLVDIQDAKAGLTGILIGMRNPARNPLPGELEAYLELKHAIQETLPLLTRMEANLLQLQRKMGDGSV